MRMQKKKIKKIKKLKIKRKKRKKLLINIRESDLNVTERKQSTHNDSPT